MAGLGLPAMEGVDELLVSLAERRAPQRAPTALHAMAKARTETQRALTALHAMAKARANRVPLVQHGAAELLLGVSRRAEGQC